MSFMTKSPWLIHYDGASCNGCDLEVLASMTPMYDLERFGIINAGSPKHADLFLVTGAVNEQGYQVIKQIYDQMPRPKVVVAVGACAVSGGIFRECYNIHGGVDSVIPVDVYVSGCAARPEAIIDGIIKGLGVLEEKRAKMPEELLAEKAALDAAAAVAAETEAETAEIGETAEAGGEATGTAEVGGETIGTAETAGAETTGTGATAEIGGETTGTAETVGAEMTGTRATAEIGGETNRTAKTTEVVAATVGAGEQKDTGVSDASGEEEN